MNPLKAWLRREPQVSSPAICKPALELLEDRSVPSTLGLLPVEPITVNPPPIHAAPESPTQADTSGRYVDAGDFYWYSGNKIPLLQDRYRLTIVLEDGMDEEQWFAEFTGSGALLEGWSSLFMDNDNVILLEWTGETDPWGEASYDSFLEDVFSLTGLAAAGPGFNTRPDYRELTEYYVTNEFIFDFTDSASGEDVLNELFGSGWTRIGNVGPQWLVRLEGESIIDLLRLANTAFPHEGIGFVEPNAYFRIELLGDPTPRAITPATATTVNAPSLASPGVSQGQSLSTSFGDPIIVPPPISEGNPNAVGAPFLQRSETVSVGTGINPEPAAHSLSSQETVIPAATARPRRAGSSGEAYANEQAAEASREPPDSRSSAPGGNEMPSDLELPYCG